MSVQDFTDWNAPAAHATAIAQTGVPLLSVPSNLIQQIGQVIGASNTASYGPFSVTQPGWAAEFIVQANAAATVPYVEVKFLWTDAVSSIVYGEDHYVIPGGSGASSISVLGQGVCQSSQLTVTVTNLDPAQSVTVTTQVAQDSVIRFGDRWRFRNAASNGAVVPGLTLATLPDDETCLGILNGVTVAASAGPSWLFGMAPGKLITLSGFVTTITPSSINIQVRSQPSQSYGANAYLGFFLPAAADFTFTFNAGRAPIGLKVQNSSTVAGTFTAMMTAAD